MPACNVRVTGDSGRHEWNQGLGCRYSFSPKSAGLKVLLKAKAFSDEAFENILDAPNLTKTQKMDIFSTLLTAGANLDDLLDKLGKCNDVAARRLLIIAAEAQ